MKTSKITSVDFFDDLSSPYARKRFFWGFIALGAISLVAVHVVRTSLTDGALRDVFEATAIEVFSGSIIILFFYFLYLYFIGPNSGLREVTVIRPKDITERMELLPVGARHYIFWGRSGSYFRSYPLLSLDRESRAQKLITHVDVVLPDPGDERLIKSYSQILASLGEEPSPDALLSNVLATSITCAVIRANNKYLKLRLFYSTFLPAFRVDISEQGAILTQDDPKKSALFFDFGSEFYEMFRTTVHNEMAVSREVEWDDSLFVNQHINEKSCDQQTLSAFGIPMKDVDALQRRVGDLVANPSHRYK